MYDSNDMACTKYDPELWFSEARSKVKKAKAICASCLVQRQCLINTLDYEATNQVSPGVFGGLTEKERRALLRRVETKRQKEIA